MVGGIRLRGKFAVHRADELGEVVKDGAKFVVVAGLSLEKANVGFVSRDVGRDLDLGLVTAGALDLVAEVGEKQIKAVAWVGLFGAKGF